MRTRLLIPALIVSAGTSWAGNAIYLDDAALAKLRVSNPDHYARAMEVMDAANQLCRPGLPEISFTKANARQVECSAMLLRTSDPPKRQIEFRLDDTRYVALVAVTDDPPRLVNAN